MVDAGADRRNSAAAPLTVVIPVYGPGPHLERVVAALKAQTLPISDIIISHSGSDDPSPRFAAASDVRVLHSAERLFAGAARNRGLELVETEWVAFVDEDVIVDPCWHAEMAAAIAAGNASCIVGAISYAETGGYWGLSQWVVEFSALHPYMPERYVHGGASANMAVKTDAFRNIGGFPEGLHMGEDTTCQALLRGTGHSIWFAPGPIGQHVNILGLRRMLKHNYTLGVHSARVRRTYSDLPGSRAARWPILSPGLWLVRLSLTCLRAFRYGDDLSLFLIHLPGAAIGLIAWNSGYVLGLAGRGSSEDSIPSCQQIPQPAEASPDAKSRRKSSAKIYN